ncbi:hypothetical protein [Phycicoccus sp. SLBN-51]|uniref:hypothetical protein n=1 Tax=Phycicoccus sp. SLBN-51 TaxID=2768447 RepID=UPI00115250AC|nr:hypothetical protein [Phycicoccus sp. SLBN-51]TQJ51752.1 hypothetical protein FBY26_3490 [Phycicoccus sp. SLBN-51]
MSVGWVAGSVRARAMAKRRLGRDGALELATSPTPEAAVELLARTTYGRHVHAGQSTAQAERGVLQALVWNARVLAGWTTRDGVAALRTLLSPLEILAIEEHLQRLTGPVTEPGRPSSTLELGGLATAWPRLRGTGTPAAVRAALVTSAWGDPGGDSPREVLLWLRCSVADRVTLVAPAAATWAARSTALLLGRELLTGGGPLPSPAAQAASRVVGRSAAQARRFTDLAPALSRSTRSVLEGVTGPAELWGAEARWWLAVERDSEGLVRAPRPGLDVLVGAVGLLAADAWRVRAALQAAAHGAEGLEVFRAAA